MSLSSLAAVAEGRHRDPFAVLGPHRTPGGIVVRALQPSARSVDVRLMADGVLLPMRRSDEGDRAAGVFEIRLPGEVPDYRLRITYTHGHVVEIDDPYRYGRVLTDFDLHLLGEGTHHRAFERLGAHRGQRRHRPSACTLRCGRPTPSG